MSVNAHTYIGPYIEADIETKKIETKVLANPVTGKIFNSGKFDPETGTELKEISVMEDLAIHPKAYINNTSLGLVEDMFYSPDFMCWPEVKKIFLLNEKCLECGVIRIGDGDLIEIGEDTINPSKSILYFVNKYKDYLDYYEYVCNYTIRIKYGIVTYYS